jgi:hypothetical protein
MGNSFALHPWTVDRNQYTFKFTENNFGAIEYTSSHCTLLKSSLYFIHVCCYNFFNFSLYPDYQVDIKYLFNTVYQNCFLACRWCIYFNPRQQNDDQFLGQYESEKQNQYFNQTDLSNRSNFKVKIFFHKKHHFCSFF